MKRINSLMILSLSAFILSLISLLLSSILFLNVLGKLNEFMKRQININESTINQLGEMQEFENKIMNVINNYNE